MFGKAEDKANEAAGAVEEAFGKAVDSPEHQVRGAARKYASQSQLCRPRRSGQRKNTGGSQPAGRRGRCGGGRHRFRLLAGTQISGERAARQQARYGPFFVLFSPCAQTFIYYSHRL